MTDRSSLSPLVSRRSLLGRIGLGTLAAPAVLRSSPALAAWPSDKAVKLVVPFAAGGPPDIVARIIANPLAEVLGTSVVTENKAGAGGNIGIASVARAEPDGYTLLVCSGSFMLNPSLFESVPYDPLADFAVLGEMATSPNVISVDPKLGIRTIADLVAAAKATPERFTYASPGTGTPPALSLEVLKARTGLKMPPVVFTGASPAIQAVLSSAVPVVCTALPPSHPHIKAGTLQALAVTGERRWSDLPDVPTMKELGYKDFVHETVNLIWAPIKTPAPIVERLAREIDGIIKRPAVRTAFEKAGFEVLQGGIAPAKARVEREVPMWREVVAQTGIKLK